MSDINPNLEKTIETIKHGEFVEVPRPVTEQEKNHAAETYERGANAMKKFTGKKTSLPPWLEDK